MTHRHALDLTRYHAPLLAILCAVAAEPELAPRHFERLRKQHLKDGKGFFSADDLVAAYRALAGTQGLPPFDEAVLERLRLKPIRTQSGVTPLTVFTKPYPCPGECIFCPNDVRMPKSYLSDEPGAQRAEQNSFDPYLQTHSRLMAFYNTGHPTDKIEIIILGGTWSFYPETYQIWFVRRVFDALHDFGSGIDRTTEVRAALLSESQLNHANHAQNVIPQTSIAIAIDQQTYNQRVQSIYRDEMYRSREQAQAVGRGELSRTAATEYATWDELAAAHHENESAACRCVGLVIETRPDYTDPAEVIRLRRLGCTKVQLGFQSLNDTVLRANRRGHTVATIRHAVHLFRQAGFKIHVHWMPNLYRATPDSDRADYRKLFDDPAFRPDELKIYPCSLIESAELMGRYRDGSWRPYTHAELLGVLTDCLEATPEYCRLTRIIRDIPATDIVVGNTVSNLRQVAEQALAGQGKRSRDIRAREIGGALVERAALYLDTLEYEVSSGREVFLQWLTDTPTHARQVAAFLRLSLPRDPSFIAELGSAAIIREVHVYGQALAIGESAVGKAQHSGLGAGLIERAAELATAAGYAQLAVISAVGTRGYYRKRGFRDGLLYQFRTLA